MELKWLEDFLSLTSNRSFSKAAEERHTTQSSLSRRIQSLEDWLGIPLVDRSSYPVNLSRAGEQFHRFALTIVRSSYRARAAARACGVQNVAPLRFGAQHVLARHFLPEVVRQIETRMEIGAMQLKSDNLSSCVEELANGEIDFMVCYYHPTLPEVIDRQRYPSICMRLEQAIPVCAPDKDGNPLYLLPGHRESPLPYVGFTSEVPMGWNRESQLESNNQEIHIDLICESTMGEIIREFVLDGRGFTWLQSSLVNDDLAQGRLVRSGGDEWAQTSEIRIFRSMGPGSNQLERVWKVLADLAEMPPENSRLD